MVILSPSKKDFKSRDVNLSIIDNYVLCHNVLIYNEVLAYQLRHQLWNARGSRGFYASHMILQARI